MTRLLGIPGTLHDEVLVESARRDDAGAFEQLVVRQYVYVQDVFDPAEFAEDELQNACVKARYLSPKIPFGAFWNRRLRRSGSQIRSGKRHRREPAELLT